MKGGKGKKGRKGRMESRQTDRQVDEGRGRGRRGKGRRKD